MNRREFVADVAGERLDRALARWMPDLSRSRAQRLIRGGWVRVDGEPTEPSLRLRPGQRVVVLLPPPESPALEPTPIPLRILYQDEDLLVVDKPPGLPVHPGPGHPRDTLVNALLALGVDLSTVGGVHRPGIVHRLDKDTSGLVVVARHDRAHQALARQFQERTLRKGYLALVWGVPSPPEGVVDAPIGRDPRNRKRMAVVPTGKPARTRYRVRQVLDGLALVEAWPETGRTHQVRVHLAHLGHPIVGDPLYSRRKAPWVPRLFLHAHFLAFRLPSTGEWGEFTSPLPEDLAEALRALKARGPAPRG